MPNLLLKAQQYLQNFNQQPPLHTMTPAEVRKLRATTKKVNLPTNVNLSTITDQWITVRDGEQIKIRLYTPIGEGPFPVIIYYHGGGWVLNSIETSDASCQMLASMTNSIVVSVDYRLAPEYKFPIPMYDAYDAFLWVTKNIQAIHGIPEKISVMGDSAGANLATVVTLQAKQANGPTIASQILLYPVTELTYDSPSYYEFAEGYGLNKKDMEWFGNYYLEEDSQKNNPYVAPLKAKDVTGLPAALIIVAENDVLRDEGIAYGDYLKSSGVYVEQLMAKGLIHSFFTKNEIFQEEIEKTIQTVHSFINQKCLVQK
ncbi:alpha/beta hydrolase [Lysinibacillus sp. BW-2-10]|uniref:alpha/beta hydrolase n=1 Tax=Lysinibacillus sp. BW-2-10 TaxID=2590030 RepID=UPI0021047817|nr:alpha/beta hydrolase [Lysinibacillus sp. BW-2-10]